MRTTASSPSLQILPSSTAPRAHSNLPRLLTVDGTAEVLGLSAKTIRRMIDRGDLPVHRPGRAIRIAETDLLAYIARTRQ